jgi:putative transposase
MDTAETSEHPINHFVGIDAKTGRRIPSLYRNRVRIRGPRNIPANCYHVMSRITADVPLFDDLEKEALRRLIRKMASFLHVRLLTYCVMHNHFHALIEVPHPTEVLAQYEGPEGEALLLTHLSTFYSHVFMNELRQHLEDERKGAALWRPSARLEGMKKRFCDLSVWTKEVKERFVKWLNKRRQRKGTLWMDRFKSVLIQDGVALKTIAAYIDLNPVRAGLVTDPKDYRWCGYAEALAGEVMAQQGICRIMRLQRWAHPSSSYQPGACEAYRIWLFEEGTIAPVAAPPKAQRMMARHQQQDYTQPSRRGFSAQQAHGVRHAERGQLPLALLLQQRVRHFSQGIALGSKKWIEQIFDDYRNQFGPTRKTGARRLLGIAEEQLYTLRDLRPPPSQ